MQMAKLLRTTWYKLDGVTSVEVTAEEWAAKLGKVVLREQLPPVMSTMVSTTRATPLFAIDYNDERVFVKTVFASDATITLLSDGRRKTTAR